MGLKGKLRRLERLARGRLDSFVLADGTRHYYAPQEAFSHAFLFFSASLRADHSGEPRPAPPGILEAISKARDRGAALSRALGGFSHLLPVDEGALVERGEFVPRSLVAGVEYQDLGALEDLSE